MEQNNSGEIDLMYVFNGFKNVLKRIVILLFSVIFFVRKTWYIFAGLIILGVVLGYFSDSKSTSFNQSSNSLLKINFESVDYVYGEVELINMKLIQRDTLFIENLGLNIDSTSIIKLELSPIINLKNVVDNYGVNSRYLEGLLKNVEINEEVSEMFSSEFKYHNLNIILSENGTKEDVDKIIHYLNSNPLLSRIRDSKLKNMNDRIINNDKIISQVDQVIEAYIKNGESSADSPPSSGVYIIDKNINIDQIIQKKIILQRENERILDLLIYSKDIVLLVNNPNLVKESSFLSKKITYYPILFVVLFSFFAFLRNGYYYLKEIADNA